MWIARVIDLIAGALFGLLIGIGCLPGLLHSAKVYCDEGYKICVERPHAPVGGSAE